MILLIDNYDSFSYNLYQLIGTFDENIVVIRNDEKNIKEIPLNIKTFAPTETIKKYIDQAMASGSWLILTFHRISKTSEENILQFFVSIQ